MRSCGPPRRSSRVSPRGAAAGLAQECGGLGNRCAVAHQHDQPRAVMQMRAHQADRACVKTQRHTFFEPPAEAGTGEGERGCGGGVDRERVESADAASGCRRRRARTDRRRQEWRCAGAGSASRRASSSSKAIRQMGVPQAKRFLAGKRRVGIEEGEMAGAAGDQIGVFERGASASGEPGEPVLCRFRSR